VHALLRNGAEASLPWKLLRTHLESCASIVQAVIYRPLSSLSRPNQSSDAVRSRNPFKSQLARDAVATAVSHKHHLIICVGAGLIQFVCGSHSKRDHRDYPSQRSIFTIFFAGIYPQLFVVGVACIIQVSWGSVHMQVCMLYGWFWTWAYTLSEAVCGGCCVHYTSVLGVSAYTGVYVIQVFLDISMHICEHTRCRLLKCALVCAICSSLLGVEDGEGQLVYGEHLSLGVGGCFWQEER